MPQELLTVTQVARELERVPRTIINLIHAGRLEATKLGDGKTSAYVISREELDRFKQAS